MLIRLAQHLRRLTVLRQAVHPRPRLVKPIRLARLRHLLIQHLRRARLLRRPVLVVAVAQRAGCSARLAELLKVRRRAPHDHGAAHWADTCRLAAEVKREQSNAALRCRFRREARSTTRLHLPTLCP
jgi:hypothetical protein